MLEVFHPELAQGMDPATTEGRTSFIGILNVNRNSLEDERGGSDDEEYAVSNKPKQLQGVIKCMLSFRLRYTAFPLHLALMTTLFPLSKRQSF